MGEDGVGFLSFLKLSPRVRTDKANHPPPGVYCRFPIKRGQFIDKYVGEIITAAEADSRRNDSAVAKHKDIYLFALDKFTNLASNDARLRGPPLEVDGEYFSGPTRFINHSCDPNLRIFARVGDYADKHLHDLAFFAIRDIPAETELTFDYVDGEGHGPERRCARPQEPHPHDQVPLQE